MITPLINIAHAAGPTSPLGTLTPVTRDLSITELALSIYNNFIVWILGAACLGAIIWAGILFMTSQGEPEKVTKARNALLWAIVGLVLIVLSYAIVVYLNQLVSSL